VVHDRNGFAFLKNTFAFFSFLRDCFLPFLFFAKVMALMSSAINSPREMASQNKEGGEEEEQKKGDKVKELHPSRVQYVIVLTKADKRKEGAAKLRSNLNMVRQRLEANGCDPNKTPVLLTSSVNRLGRDHMWRFLRLAADPQAFNSNNNNQQQQQRPPVLDLDDEENGDEDDENDAEEGFDEGGEGDFLGKSVEDDEDEGQQSQQSHDRSSVVEGRSGELCS
jgi:hypothetical protein